VAFLAVVAGIAVSALPSDKRRGPVVPWTLAIAGALVALHGLYQKLWGLDELIRVVEQGMALADREVILERAAGGRAFAGFPTPAALGGYLALALPVTLGAAAGRRGRARAVLLTLAVVQTAGVLSAASATAGAALLGAVLIGVLVHGRQRRALVAGLLAAALVLIGIAALRGAELTDFEDRRGPWRLRAANVRLAASVAADHPWIGVGPGGFGEAYPAYRRPGDNETQHAHDLPLELAAELGWPLGGLSAVVFFWLLLGPLFRRTEDEPRWCRGAALGLAAFALHNLADFTAFLPSLLWSAAVVRGAISRPSGDRKPGRWLLAATAAATLAAAAVAAASGLAANERVAVRQAAAEQDATAAYRHAGRAVAFEPWRADGYLLRAGAGLTAAEGDPEERLRSALADVERAVALAPTRAAARRMRAELRRSLGDLPGAYADAARAAELHPVRREYGELRDRLLAELPSPERTP
jgi:O-antigen ligase